MLDRCDLAYVMIADRIERDVHTERIMVATLMASGAKGLTLPTYEQEMAAFDAALVAPVVAPTAVDADRLALHQALGVAS